MDISMLSAFSNQMADAVERVAKSLVMVNGRARQPATGIAYADDIVLTADHVLERENNLTVQTHDDRVLGAQIIGRDASTDLAVLRVQGLGVPLATAAAGARAGQLALAVGRPSPDGVMASLGVVSKVGSSLRIGRSSAILERYIQTDAIPYPGFSGGALVDVTGAVFGLLTTGLVRGAAMVIPMDIALKVASALTKQGYVKRGYLGIVSQQVRLPPAQRSDAQEYGLLIVRVEENSPAERGGLLIGDILLAVEGQPINDADDLMAVLHGDRVGKPVAVRVSRGGIAQTLTVVVGQKS
ncbi:MAG: signal protein PDZ [Candidatus Thermofonsia Clade 3 bacterium]|jgi:S1-C subfamily serine protease|uniref:Signal protein PDZ n=2 Tax=Candidatus Thermofonsia Clade 3 TaxID=2364209 RepID=A0A2M8QEM2_9CHLR|nr:MAG: signal protein PDZ [Candidatus Thermofonsia Clade 3 bacterium]